jgi:hypothetical protein
MSLLLPTLVAVSVLTTALPLYAEDRVMANSGLHSSLIELYSSEGCSSCPPAEAWINALQASPELWKSVFPVVFHVDYWNNLGWRDRFSNSLFTRRQQNYASELGQSSIYTPEFIVNGREWRGWFNKGSLPSTQRTEGTLSLRVDPEGKKLSATFRPASDDFDRSCTFHVALLGSNIDSNIRGGENGGRVLHHNFVVLDFNSRPLSKSGGYQSGPILLKPSADAPPSGVVAWVRAEDGSILQVAGGPIPFQTTPH